MPEIFRKMKGFLLGVDDEYDDDYEDDDYDEYEDARAVPDISTIPPRRGQAPARGTANLRSISSVTPSNIVGLHKQTQIDCSFPKGIEDARDVIDNTRENVITIVNLEGVDVANAQRIADFLSGSVDALEGSISRLSGDIFLIAPNGVEITGDVSADVNDRLKRSGTTTLPWLNSASFR